MEQDRIAKYLLRGLCSVRSDDKQRYLEKALFELWGNELTEAARRALKWKGGRVEVVTDPDYEKTSEPSGHGPPRRE